MKALVITPKNESEFKFISGLLKKLGVGTSSLDQNELEDIGMSKLMRDVDKTKKGQPIRNNEKVNYLMKVEYLKRFSKDLENIKAKSLKQTLIRLIELMETIKSLDEIPGLEFPPKAFERKPLFRYKAGSVL